MKQAAFLLTLLALLPFTAGEWPCNLNVCRNGGTCVDFGDFTYTCVACPPAWTGTYCETPTNIKPSSTASAPTTRTTTTTPTTRTTRTSTTSTTTVESSETTESAEDPSNCFPADAMVELEDGSSIALGLLQTGQRVRTVTADDSTRYSTVLAFLDRKDGFFDFVRLHTQQGHLDVSDKHLVAIVSASKRLFVPAEQIRVGDFLVAGNGSALPVTSVSWRRARGAFAPLTMEGTLLVMDTLCSCYAVTTSHTLAEVVMAPLKLWYSLFGTQQTASGIHWYAETLIHVASTTGLISV